MINNIKIEICLGNIQDIKVLNNYPVDRIELNSALELGGLSPSINTLISAKQSTNIPIMCMVRCRGGNFTYTKEEYDVMYEDAKLLLKNKADGIVFGFLDKNNKINITETKRFIELAKTFDAQVVFHKAFDEIIDQEEAIKQLIDLKVDRILTSGKADSKHILDGCNNIRKLQDKYGNNIELLPGGGVRINNIKEIVNICNSKQVHMTSKKTYEGNYIGLDENQLIDLLNELR